MAVGSEGRREIVGLHIGPSEAETFWSTFLRRLHKRGLTGVKLVISGAHEGLKGAIRRVFSATWQRCRVGLLKNWLGCDSTMLGQEQGAAACWGDVGRSSTRSSPVRFAI